jgi:recombination protein RecA
MAEIWKDMEKVHGEEGLYAGDSSMTTYSDSISTGSYALDDALGIWGVPKGHIVQYAGFESSGKTLLALCTVAEWQKKNPDNWAMFIDAEFSFDQEWAKSLGVDTSRLLVYRENKAAAIFDHIVGVPMKRSKDGTVKKLKQGILDIEIEVGGSGLGVIVLDSIAAMQPPAEEASVAGKDNMALMARFLPPELRKLTPLLTATGVTFIAINQLRFQPGVMYGDPTMSPGGTALKYACAQMVNLGMIRSAESYILNDQKEQIGHKIRAKVQKNKKAPPFRVAEFAIKYTNGIVNKNEELRDIGARYGIIDRPNNKVWVLDGVKYNGKDAIAEAIKKDPELQLSLLDRSKEAKKNYKGPVLTEPDEENDEEIETSKIVESTEE